MDLLATNRLWDTHVTRMKFSRFMLYNRISLVFFSGCDEPKALLVALLGIFQRGLWEASSETGHEVGFRG